MIATRPPEPRAGTASPRPLTDRFLRWLGRLALDAFYRRIDVVGADRFPATGPVIVIANHSNSLVDAAAITACLPRMSRFLGASTVWDYRLLRPFLNAAGVVPLYRRQDGRAHQGSLADSFSLASDLLEAGGVLAIFPEGISHNNPRVLPLKTGAARIALESAANRGPLRITMLPVCLTFEAKYRVRSRALVEIGAPIALDPIEIEAYRSGTRSQRAGLVRTLTQHLHDRLDAMTPGHESWEEARLVARAAEMIANADPETRRPDALAEITHQRRRIHEGYLWVSATHPDRTEKLRREIAEYDRMLRSSGLRDDQVARGATFTGASSSISGRTWVMTTLLAPVALVGLCLNLLPFWILRMLSRRKDLDKRSTWSIFAGLFVFPAFWLASGMFMAILAGSIWGALSGSLFGIATVVVALATGRPTLTFLDCCTALMADFRARIVLRSRSKRARQLSGQRGVIQNELMALTDAFDRVTALAEDNGRTDP